MSRYAIWNKTDPILTANGKVYTPEQWIEKYPVAGRPNVTVVCKAGDINGSFFATLGMLEAKYTREGCDFSACVTDEDKLNVIEAFLDAREAADAEAIAETKAIEAVQADALASIAASLEYQNLMTLPDVEV